MSDRYHWNWISVHGPPLFDEAPAKGVHRNLRRIMRMIWGFRGGESGEGEGGVSWGPNTIFCCVESCRGRRCSPPLHTAPCLRFEQSCSLAHPRHFPSPFYSILRSSFSFHKPVYALIRALSPQSFFPPHPYSSLTIIAFSTRLALLLHTCSLSSSSIPLSHGHNSSTAKADQEGLSR